MHLERRNLFHGHDPLDTDSTPNLKGEDRLMHNGYTQAEKRAWRLRPLYRGVSLRLALWCDDRATIRAVVAPLSPEASLTTACTPQSMHRVVLVPEVTVRRELELEAAEARHERELATRHDDRAR